MVEHGRTMAQLYIWTICVAGAFTLLPGRRMNAVLFGGESWAGFGLGALALAGLAVVIWRAQPGQGGVPAPVGRAARVA